MVDKVARLHFQPASPAGALRALSARFVEWRYARRTDGECDPHPLIRDLRKFRPA